MKRTRWFDAEKVDPVHIGDYEYTWDAREAAGFRPIRMRWDGNYWRQTHPTDGSAASVWTGCGDRWRGLVRKP